MPVLKQVKADPNRNFKGIELLPIVSTLRPMEGRSTEKPLTSELKYDYNRKESQRGGSPYE
jgi:hypothetical protein